MSQMSGLFVGFFRFTLITSIFAVFVPGLFSAPPSPKVLSQMTGIPFADPSFFGLAARIAEELDPDIPRENYVMQDDGIEYILVLRIDFPDKPGKRHADELNSAIFGTEGTSVRLYFQEVSYGQMSILPGYLGGVVPSGNRWYRAKKKSSYYGEGTISVERYRELVLEACISADPGVDFSRYDRDGDGYVDHLIIIHSGNDEASTGIPEDIWSAAIDSVPGVYDNVRIASAMILAEDPNESSINIGIYCHEIFHDFGAPDLYSWDYPVGFWCLMGMFGPYLGNGQYPSHICGYLKWDFDADVSNGIHGWIEPITLKESGTYSIDSFELTYGNRLYKVDIPGKRGKEYFLLENRNKNAGTIYDTLLPDSGIIIWHIDETQPRSFSNPHRAWVEDPSDPYHKGNKPTSGAAYSEDDGQTSFTPWTEPNSNANDGSYSGIIITEISRRGISMSFKLFFGDSYEPNDTFEQAYGPVSFNKQYNSFIKDATDVDFYKLNVGRNSKVIVYLEDIPDNANYELEAYNVQRILIASTSEARQKFKKLAFNALEPGTYYVLVVARYGYSPEQAYSITFDTSPLGLAPGEIILKSSVAPNPGPDRDGFVRFNCTTQALVDDFSIEVYNVHGSLIYKDSIQPNKRIISLPWDINKANVASGVYIYVIKIELEGKVEMKSGKFSIIR